jgi:polar amino acid transport system substrate-binding protein
MQIKYRIKFLYFVYIISIFFEKKSFAEEWKGACETNFPPFNYLDRDGKNIGMDTEIVDLIMKKIGISYTIKNTSWDGVFSLLKNKKIDFAWQFVGTKERRKTFYLIGPFRYGFDVFMVKKSSTISNWNLLSDFNRQQVGVIKKYSYTREFNQYKGFTKMEFDNVEDLVSGLVNGKVDVIIGDFYSLNFVSKKYSYGSEIRFLPSSIRKTPRYIAFSKNNKSKSIIFEDALKVIIKSKEFKSIIEKYKNIKI